MAAVTPGSCPLAPLHTDEVSSSLEITSSTAQENKAATPAVNARTHESAPLRGGDTAKRRLEKYGLTISISEGSKTNFDSSGWTEFTFGGQLQQLHHAHNRAIQRYRCPAMCKTMLSFFSCSFPPLTPRARMEKLGICCY